MLVEQHTLTKQSAAMAPRHPTHDVVPEALIARAERVLNQRLHAHALAVGPLLDAKRTFILRDDRGTPRAVAQCASPLAPDLIARGVARADAVREALALEQKSAVLDTIARGTIEGASYAIWPYKRPLDGRGVRFVARRALSQPVLELLRAIARDTQRPVPRATQEHALDHALCAQATDVRLPARARFAARDALRRLDRGTFHPVHVAMHGDVHIGNILLDAGNPQRFVLIDWCGASIEGWPLFDLVRAAGSLEVSNARLQAELALHCKLLAAGDDAAPLQDAATHLTLAVAMLGAQLDHFPFAAYSTLVERVYARLDAATGAHAHGSRELTLTNLRGHYA